MSIEYEQQVKAAKLKILLKLCKDCVFCCEIEQVNPWIPINYGMQPFCDQCNLHIEYVVGTLIRWPDGRWMFEDICPRFAGRN